MRESDNIEMDIQNNYLSNITFQSPLKKINQNDSTSQDFDVNQRQSFNDNL